MDMICRGPLRPAGRDAKWLVCRRISGGCISWRLDSYR